MCDAVSPTSRSCDTSVMLGCGRDRFSEEQGTELSGIGKYGKSSTAVRKLAVSVVPDHALLEPYSACL